jgi:hypothetical protein
VQKTGQRENQRIVERLKEKGQRTKGKKGTRRKEASIFAELECEKRNCIDKWLMMRVKRLFLTPVRPVASLETQGTMRKAIRIFAFETP